MQVSDEVRKSVVFVLFKNKNDELKIVGTAFLVSRALLGVTYFFGYVVTAKHVIDGIDAHSINGIVYLKVNKKDGSTFIKETKLSDWKFHPSEPENVDVAVFNIYFDSDIYDIRTIPSVALLTEEIINQENIGIGDEVFITGLFVNHTGKKKNLPILRVGNIALMPDERITTQYLGDIEAYLIESRSIGGLSGSPVFVYMGKSRSKRGHLFYLLGLVHGHFDTPEGKIDTLIEDTVQQYNVNVGIAIVVPASKISEVIDNPEFVRVREEKKAELLAEKSKTK